jgi:hypothetical protein
VSFGIGYIFVFHGFRKFREQGGRLELLDAPDAVAPVIGLFGEEITTSAPHRPAIQPTDSPSAAAHHATKSA